MSDEYIRKVDAIKQCGFGMTSLHIADNLRKMRPADVVQVVHAYWIDTENYYRRWRCLTCSGHTKEAHPPFCPFCGAKMDA